MGPGIDQFNDEEMGIHNRWQPPALDGRIHAHDTEIHPISLSPAVYAVAGTLLLIVIALTAFLFMWRKSKLNWYERNILEISKDNAEIVRYRLGETSSLEDERSLIGRTRHKIHPASRGVQSSISHDQNVKEHINFRKMDSMDSTESKISSRRQSRIYRSLPDLDSSISNISIAIPAVTTPSDKRISYPDVSDKFFVPKTRTSSLSMFRGFDMSKIDKELYDSRQDSLPTEEQVLGQCGSLQMALSYDSNLSLLTVRLLQAANLLARRTDSPPNPYFKVHLIPPETAALHSQSYQTKFYKMNRSPELDDEFCFDIPAGNLHNCKLEVMVYDFDQYSVDECIGCCWLSLNRVDIPEDPALKTVFWAEIMPLESSDEEGVGDILFSLAYLSKAQRLIMTVMKARNLVSTDDMTSPPDPCVKVVVYLSKKKLKQRRTAVKKATYNPTYNEALTFNIPKNSLCDIVLSITVCHETHAFRHSKILGRLDLPLSKCKDLWRAVIKGEDSKARWYALEKPEKGYP